MKLLIDAGNTRLKWCWYDDQDMPLDFETCEYADFEAEGVHVFAGKGHDTDEVWVCNVAGDDFQEELIDAFADWEIRPEFMVSQAIQCGVTNAYTVPETLGVDRWMALLGAWGMKKDAACIVDCGSAVTIDVINDSGQHLGGLIVPGLAMMQDSLLEETADIGQNSMPEGETSSSLLASSTGPAVEAGTLYAVVALIDRVQQDLARELDTPLPLLINGGDVDLIQPLLSGESNYEPMLIFHGMIAAAETE